MQEDENAGAGNGENAVAGNGENTGSGHDKNVSGGHGENSNAGHNKDLGARGEEGARKFLECRGYEILERNWKCRFGEADIIALDEEDTVVFIEVKTRTGIEQGLPEDAITKDKRTKYEKIAMAYLENSSFENVSVRFDVIAITLIATDRALLRHHINAFGTEV